MSEIIHSGIVKKITQNYLEVSVTAGNACDGCHARSVCQPSGSHEKIIRVEGQYTMISAGDRVVVSMRAIQGFGAVVMAYLIPAFIMVTTLFVVRASGSSDGISALFALVATGCWFVILWLFRNRIQRRVMFSVRKEAAL